MMKFLDLASINDSIGSLRSDVTNAVSNISQDISSIKQSLNDVASLVSTAEKLKQSLDDFKSEQANVLSSFSMGIDSMKKSQDALSSQIITSVNDTKSLLTQLIAIKVSSLDAAKINDCGTELNLGHLGTECIEAMMMKTDILPSDDIHKSKMKRFYDKLYIEDDITSTILEFLKLQPNVKIIFDFENAGLQNILPTFKDHDGDEKPGNKMHSFVEFNQHRIYVAGKWQDEAYSLNLLSEALSQMCVYLAFNNEGRPYLKEGDEKREEQFLGILEELQTKTRNGEDMDDHLKWVLNWKTQLAREIYLISSIPWMIAAGGSWNIRSRLNRQLPSLLNFYEEYVTATLRKILQEDFEGISPEFERGTKGPFDDECDIQASD